MNDKTDLKLLQTQYNQFSQEMKSLQGKRNEVVKQVYQEADDYFWQHHELLSYTIGKSVIKGIGLNFELFSIPDQFVSYLGRHKLSFNFIGEMKNNVVEELYINGTQYIDYVFWVAHFPSMESFEKVLNNNGNQLKEKYYSIGSYLLEQLQIFESKLKLEEDKYVFYFDVASDSIVLSPTQHKISISKLPFDTLLSTFKDKALELDFPDLNITDFFPHVHTNKNFSKELKNFGELIHQFNVEGMHRQMNENLPINNGNKTKVKI